MPKGPLFTAETAVAAALKSHASRKAARERLAALEAAAVQAAIDPPSPRSSLPLCESVTPDDYTIHRLARIRKQLAQLDRLFEAETDPGKLDRLASAISKLSEVLRIAAMVPLPGSHRPSRPSRQSPGAPSVVPE